MVFAHGGPARIDASGRRPTHSLAAGFDRKYLDMIGCSLGNRHSPNTRALRAHIGMKKRSPGVARCHSCLHSGIWRMIETKFSWLPHAPRNENGCSLFVWPLVAHGHHLIRPQRGYLRMMLAQGVAQVAEWPLQRAYRSCSYRFVLPYCDANECASRELERTEKANVRAVSRIRIHASSSRCSRRLSNVGGRASRMSCQSTSDNRFDSRSRGRSRRWLRSPYPSAIGARMLTPKVKSSGFSSDSFAPFMPLASTNSCLIRPPPFR